MLSSAYHSIIRPKIDAELRRNRGQGRKRVTTHKYKPRGNNSALLEINDIIREKYEHLPRKEAVSMASADYRAKKKGGSRRSHYSRKSHRAHSRRY